MNHSLQRLVADPAQAGAESPIEFGRTGLSTADVLSQVRLDNVRLPTEKTSKLDPGSNFSRRHWI